MDFKDCTKLYLNEGIDVMRYSKRFAKLSKKIRKDIDLASDKEEALSLADELDVASKDFEDAEKTYQISKYEGMNKYNILKEQYKHLTKLARNETIKKFLVAIGGLGLFGKLAYELNKWSGNLS